VDRERRWVVKESVGESHGHGRVTDARIWSKEGLGAQRSALEEEANEGKEA
jgi:hypothetical protein